MRDTPPLLARQSDPSNNSSPLTLSLSIPSPRAPSPLRLKHLIATATYLPEGYRRLCLRYHLIAKATHLRLRLRFAKPRYQLIAMATYLAKPRFSTPSPARHAPDDVPRTSFAQFTGQEWITVAESKRRRVSMDGRDRWVDNVFKGCCVWGRQWDWQKWRPRHMRYSFVC